MDNFELSFKVLVVILLFASAKTVHAQSIERDVVSAAGAYYSTSTGQISWSLGEVATEFYKGGGYTMSQGFHQLYIDITGISGTEKMGEFSIYPNPANKGVKIEFGDHMKDLDFNLFDTGGKKILSDKSIGAEGQHYLDLRDVPAGMYLLVIKTSMNMVGRYKLIKN